MSAVLSDLRVAQTSGQIKRVGEHFYWDWRYKDLTIKPTECEISSYFLELFLTLLPRCNQITVNSWTL